MSKNSYETPCYREKIERKYSVAFEQQPEFLALVEANGNGGNGHGPKTRQPELVELAWRSVP